MQTRHVFFFKYFVLPKIHVAVEVTIRYRRALPTTHVGNKITSNYSPTNRLCNVPSSTVLSLSTFDLPASSQCLLPIAHCRQNRAHYHHPGHNHHTAAEPVCTKTQLPIPSAGNWRRNHWAGMVHSQRARADVRCRSYELITTSRDQQSPS